MIVDNNKTAGVYAKWISFKEYDSRWSGYWFKLRCSNCGFVIPDGARVVEPVCRGCGAIMKRTVGITEDGIQYE